MRGTWDLSGQDLKYWQTNALAQTAQLSAGDLTIIDLTKENITPYQVNQVLESLGWERYNEFPGYEGDRYVFYRHANYKDIVLYASILTFECYIYLQENFSKNTFRKEHIERMLNKA